jgi:branched-chain amino acid transport system permease protein
MNQVSEVWSSIDLRERWATAPTWVRMTGSGILLAIAIYLPFLNVLPFAYIRTDLTTGGSDWSGVLTTIVIYMIVAVGLNVVIGMAGLLDLGYVGFYAIGAYSIALFGSPDSPVTKWFSDKFGLSEGWSVPFVACVPIAIAIALMAGVVLGAPTLRLRGDYLAIVTMGFGEIIRIISRNANWLCLAVLILLVWLVRRLEYSRVGRSWLAIREDEDAAAVMGVSGFKFKLWAFAIGAAVGAIAGLLFGSKQQFVEPTGFALNLSFLFVAMVVIGGSGNMVGALFGAFLITYLPERFRGLSDWRPFCFGVALVLVMILRPQGLIPNRRRARELEDRRLEAEEVATDD